MSILIDTNVVSELMKNQGNPAVLSWLARQALGDLHLAVTTLQELRYGIARLSPGRRRSGLEAGLDDIRQRRFHGRIIDIDQTAALRCGEIRATADRHGRPAGLADAEIAAIALTRSMTIATRDLADFAGFGVALVNPFDPKASP
jgi:toxin FitB